MRRLWLTVTCAVVLVSSARAQEPPSIASLYVVGLAGGGLGIDEEETILISMVRMSSRTFWIAERRRRETNSIVRTSDLKHDWIDGRTCPALKAALDQLSQLPSAKFATPQTFADTGGVTDTPVTSLRGPPANSIGVGVWISRREWAGPLTDWRLKAERALSPCWNEKKVEIEGTEVRAYLDTDAKARDLRP